MDQTQITGSLVMKLGGGRTGILPLLDTNGESGEPALSVSMLGIFVAIFIGETGRGQLIQN